MGTIDIAISPQQTTVSALLAHVRRGDMVAVHSLRRGAAEAIKADLEAQLAAGATLYGIRSDGAYIARTKDGDRVIRRPSPESA